MDEELARLFRRQGDHSRPATLRSTSPELAAIAALGERGSGSWAWRVSIRINSAFAAAPPQGRAPDTGGEAIALSPGDQPAAAPAAEPPQRQEPSSLLIETPIRSGQSVIFPYGDVTVLGSVSSGAEIVAGGSIHVYGALRGRAMAGSMGDTRARIFCSKNEAELVSIDGYYRTAEEMDASLRDRPAQCWLQDRVLSIAALD
jgi:septum site-determining protein MinC